MNQVQAESGIPIPPPPRNPGGGSPTRYPWQSMEIGQSFPMNVARLQGAYEQASAAGRRYGRKFLVRLTDAGIRCWRTA